MDEHFCLCCLPSSLRVSITAILGLCFMMTEHIKIIQPETDGDFWNHELLFMEVIKAVNRDWLLALFIYLYLFATYLCEPGLLTTNCCTKGRLKGHLPPTANASVSCSAHCWWAKPSVLLWSHFPLPFNFPKSSVGVLSHTGNTVPSSGAQERNVNIFWHCKTGFCSLSQTCFLCWWKHLQVRKCLSSTFPSWKYSQFTSGSYMGHFLINPFHECWHCITWLG